MSSSFGLQTGVSTSSRHRESLEQGSVLPLNVCGPSSDGSYYLDRATLEFYPEKSAGWEWGAREYSNSSRPLG